MSGDGESESNVHAAGISLHRSVNKFLDFSEGNNLVKFMGNFGLAHAKNGAVEIDIFPSGEFRVKARANLEQ